MSSLLSIFLVNGALARDIAWTVGPSALYTLPGVSVGGVQAVAPRWVSVTEAFGEGVSGVLRLGVRAGGDFLFTSDSDGLRGGYVGGRLNAWWVRETPGSTFALSPGVTAGWRWITERGALFQAGVGVTRPIVLSGDNSFRLPLPVLELRIGHTLARE